MSDLAIPSSSTIAPNYDPTTLPTDGFDTLTGDALLTYCQARMGDLDGEIKMRMGDQKNALARRQAIQTAEQVFKKYGDNGPQNQDQWDDCETSIFNAENALPPNDPARATLEKFRFDLEHQYCRDIAPDPHYPKDGEWKGNIDGLTKMEEDIKGSAEIEMLQLQQLMSQRQTAVQLTTNMMAKIDQTADSIVKNV